MPSSTNYNDKYSTLKGNAMKIEFTEQDIDYILESIILSIADEKQYIDTFQKCRPQSVKYSQMRISQLENMRGRIKAQLGKEVQK